MPHRDHAGAQERRRDADIQSVGGCDEVLRRQGCSGQCTFGGARHRRRAAGPSAAARGARAAVARRARVPLGHRLRRCHAPTPGQGAGVCALAPTAASARTANAFRRDDMAAGAGEGEGGSVWWGRWLAPTRQRQQSGRAGQGVRSVGLRTSGASCGGRRPTRELQHGTKRTPRLGNGVGPHARCQPLGRTTPRAAAGGRLTKRAGCAAASTGQICAGEAAFCCCCALSQR